MTLQKIASHVRAVDLESFLRTAVLVYQPHVVKHGARIKQFRIKLQAATLPRERAPMIDAARMMKEQRRFRVSYQLRNLARERAVRCANLVNRRSHFLAPTGGPMWPR